MTALGVLVTVVACLAAVVLDDAAPGEPGAAIAHNRHRPVNPDAHAAGKLDVGSGQTE